MPAWLSFVLELIVRMSRHCIFEGTVEDMDKAPEQGI
jgi:hypothetical protein